MGRVRYIGQVPLDVQRACQAPLAAFSEAVGRDVVCGERLDWRLCTRHDDTEAVNVVLHVEQWPSGEQRTAARPWQGRALNGQAVTCYVGGALVEAKRNGRFPTEDGTTRRLRAYYLSAGREIVGYAHPRYLTVAIMAASRTEAQYGNTPAAVGALLRAVLPQYALRLRRLFDKAEARRQTADRAALLAYCAQAGTAATRQEVTQRTAQYAERQQRLEEAAVLLRDALSTHAKAQAALVHQAVLQERQLAALRAVYNAIVLRDGKQVIGTTKPLTLRTRYGEDYPLGRWRVILTTTSAPRLVPLPEPPGTVVVHPHADRFGRGMTCFGAAFERQVSALQARGDWLALLALMVAFLQVHHDEGQDPHRYPLYWNGEAGQQHGARVERRIGAVVRETVADGDEEHAAQEDEAEEAPEGEAQEPVAQPVRLPDGWYNVGMLPR